MLKRKTLVLLSFLISLVSITQAEDIFIPAPRTAHSFKRVLQVIERSVVSQLMERKNSPKKNFNPVEIFTEGVINASVEFETIEDEISMERLAEHSKIEASFKKLSDTIAALDKISFRPTRLKPRHIRNLTRDITALGKSAQVAEKNARSEAEFSLIRLIQTFSRTMHTQVLPLCHRYFGTGLEHMADFFVHRPWEFVKRNWWWTVPLAIAGGKVAWDTISYPENARVNPEEWVPRENGNPEMSWYKKIIGVLASGALISKFNDGYTKMNGHTYVGQPIGAELPARVNNNARYKRYEMRIKRKEDGTVDGDPEQVEVDPYQFTRTYKERVITQLPCLRQSGVDCGLHTLYNLTCLARGRHQDLVNRGFFRENMHAWKQHLFGPQLTRKLEKRFCKEKAKKLGMEKAKRESAFLSVDQLESVIQQFDFFRPIRRNQRQQVSQHGGNNAVYNYLQDNVSLVGNLAELEGIFRNNNRVELQNIVLAQGSHNHAIRNIDRFRNHNAHRQIIIVNEGTEGRFATRGYHWFAMAIEHNPNTDTDHIIITESMNNDYRKRRIIERVYHLFRTDRAEQNLHLNHLINDMP